MRAEGTLTTVFTQCVWIVHLKLCSAYIRGQFICSRTPSAQRYQNNRKMINALLIIFLGLANKKILHHSKDLVRSATDTPVTLQSQSC